MPKYEVLRTVKDFRQYAKKHKYRGYSRLKKAELQQLLSNPPPDYEAIKEARNEERRQRGEYTRKELKEIANDVF